MRRAAAGVTQYRAASSLVALLIGVLTLAAPSPLSAQNLLRNGDFSEGRGNIPTGWYHESWVEVPTTSFSWTKPSGGEPGYVTVRNDTENSARWIQTVHLNPGWYYVGAQVETNDVGRAAGQTGAMVSLTGLGLILEDIEGTTDWQNRFFYLKVGRGGADVQIALGIGFFWGFDTGGASFRSASVVPVDAPTPGVPVIDVDKVNAHYGQSSSWWIVLVVAALMVTAVYGWIIFPASAAFRASAAAVHGAGAWSAADTANLAALTVIAAITRLWRLGYPQGVVFDEIFWVGQAGSYLRGEQYIDPHPPLARELMALGMWAFGPEHSWAWRLSVAVVGTLLVAVTYLLGRRLFQSRLAGVLAASLIVFEGTFMVDSRIALPEITYLTLAAISYLLVFRFVQSSNPHRERYTLLLLGAALGLGLGAKLLLPGVALLLVGGVMAYALATQWPALDDRGRRGRYRRGSYRQRYRMIGGVMLIVGSTSAICYVATFIPNFIWLGWRGPGAFAAYYHDFRSWERSVNEVGDLRGSPWWSWPLMAHPFLYWRESPGADAVTSIWFGGNPILWWGASGAICVTAVRMVRRPSLRAAFILAGYFGFLIIEVPITRVMYLYHYLPALFLAFLALAGLLNDCWQGRAQRWEQALIAVPIAASAALAIGGTIGIGVATALAIGFGAIVWRSASPGKLIFVSFSAAALIAFVYFFPVWSGMPISPASFEARMWMRGPGLFDWASY